VKLLKKKDLKMKKFSTILLIALTFTTSCKTEPNLEYKYLQEDELFECGAIDMDLIKEAVYAFEDYIKQHYSIQGEKSIEKGYYFYWEVSKGTRIPAVEFIDDHILAIRDELKKVDNLWVINGNDAQLNMEHPIVKCIGDYMQDQKLKPIFNVLTESKTFKHNVFIAPMGRDPQAIRNDRALCTYLALNTFYARILNLDFSNLDELIEINKRKFYEEQKEIFEASQRAMENQEGEKIEVDSSNIEN
jgi:hypothetical protein